MGRGVLVDPPTIELVPLHWKHEVLVTGLPGKFQEVLMKEKERKDGF